MRAVVQRVAFARVSVVGEVVGSCGKGLLVYAGAHRDDTVDNATRLADRIVGLRIFPDQDGKMNLNLAAVDDGGPRANVLAVSNFTLFGDVSQRRPSFSAAAPYAQGEQLFQRLVESMLKLGARVETGVFGADMQVEALADGPVTLVIDC
ncbi:MAG: D-tyrosyl-tRNA(Tyr) deacylase [Fimbriimonadaceae bacterium]|nr:D-tyrosyl-tRNA(Tyr) deacylase [Fimbriimonadaceae bacterium]QYK59241.1 MAG: D-tyrosyl-tRNA(Tyr) deacylase [Fimbriimonadaceae bacterium]